MGKVLYHRHIKKWRQENPDKRREYRKKNYSLSKCNNENLGQPWTKAEELAVMDPNKPSDRFLSNTMGRNVRNIEERRRVIKRRQKILELFLILLIFGNGTAKH